MFGLGMMEILMILAIALIIVGPQKLPELAKTLGRAMGEFKRSAQDLKRSMDVETTITDIDVAKPDIKSIPDQNSKTESKSSQKTVTADEPDPYYGIGEEEPDADPPDMASPPSEPSGKTDTRPAIEDSSGKVEQKDPKQDTTRFADNGKSGDHLSDTSDSGK